MERLTEKNRDRCEMCTSYVDGVCLDQCYPCDIYETYARLAAIEDILGDDYDLSRLRELLHADRDGRVKIEPIARKCPNCGKFTVFPRIDWKYFYCFSCKKQFSYKEYTEEMKGEKHG